MKTTGHPQHSTTRRSRVMPRVLRTHALITEGIDPEKADAFVMQAANNLLRLAEKAPARPLRIQPAPARQGLHELLSQASHEVRQMCPHDKRSTEEAA